MTPLYRPPVAEDFPELRAMARTAFTDSFAMLYDPREFADFCDGYYGPDGTMTRELTDPANRYCIALVDSAIVGFVRVCDLIVLQPDPPPGAMEIRQLYLLREVHGSGSADALMHWALDTARSAGAAAIYLSVFEHNHRAKAFYARHGFAETGRCPYTLGSRTDDDPIWGRRL